MCVNTLHEAQNFMCVQYHSVHLTVVVVSSIAMNGNYCLCLQLLALVTENNGNRASCPICLAQFLFFLLIFTFLAFLCGFLGEK